MNRGSLRKKPSSTLQKGKHFTNRPSDHKDDDRSEVIKEHVDQQRKTDRLDRAVLAFKVSVLVQKIMKIFHVRTGD